jgi:hypothetical protein
LRNSSPPRDRPRARAPPFPTRGSGLTERRPARRTALGGAVCSRLIADHTGRTALTVIANVDKTHPRVRSALRHVIGAAE